MNQQMQFLALQLALPRTISVQNFKPWDESHFVRTQCFQPTSKDTLKELLCRGRWLVQRLGCSWSCLHLKGRDAVLALLPSPAAVGSPRTGVSDSSVGGLACPWPFPAHLLQSAGEWPGMRDLSLFLLLKNKFKIFKKCILHNPKVCDS